MDELEKNLAEAFAILDTMDVSTNVKIHYFSFSEIALLFRTLIFLQMKPGMSKRGLRGANLDELEKNLAEAFAILDTMGISKGVRRALMAYLFLL